MERHTKKGVVLMIAGLLLIAAALAFAVYNVWDARRAGGESEAIVQELEQTIIQQATQSQAPSDEPPAELEHETAEIDGNIYAGILEIPALGLRLPIMDDWSMPKLKHAPCVYTGWYTSDDFVIAGHNYVTHFGGLRRLKPNDDIYFTTVDGDVYHYAVDYFETLGGTEIERMREKTIWDLTLFTCTIGGQSRFAVRCIRLTE